MIRIDKPATLAVLIIALGSFCAGQQQEPPSARKVTNRVVPAYPELARKMNLTGVVKLEVTVAPNGTPRSVEPRGGSPVLVKAAQDAVYKWKWVPASETKELVELDFHPE